MRMQPKTKILKRVVAMFLVCAILVQSTPVYAQKEIQDMWFDFIGNQEGDSLTEENEVMGSDEVEGYESEEPLEEETIEGEAEEETEGETEEDTLHADVFENGKIKIYNLKQLYAIGTNRVVMDGDASEDAFGMGNAISEEKPVIYSADADYKLMNEIVLDSHEPWVLPENFTGKFSGKGGDESSPLYDADTDTVYVYNNAQLQAIAAEDAEDKPIMSKDMIASEFGKGGLVYVDGSTTDIIGETGFRYEDADIIVDEEGDYLTYSSEHTYVLSPDFSGENCDDLEKWKKEQIFKNGRIQIHNLEQLYAIGSDQAVTTGDIRTETFGTGEELFYPEETQENSKPSADAEAATPSNAETATPSNELSESETRTAFSKSVKLATSSNAEEAGEAVTYSLDADYELVNDIPMESGSLWTLPEGFTGSFSKTPKEDARLYDEETDTIYIYNNYQLLLATSEKAEQEPILSGDMLPERVGIGQPIYKGFATPSNAEIATSSNSEPENSAEYLTYSGEHNYVLSADFTEKMPGLMANQYVQGTAYEGQKAGRDYIGQNYVTIEGEKYILIGNEQQLRAIGSDKSVTPMLFLRTEAKLLGIPLGHKIVPYYPGDADFNANSFLDTGISYTKDDIKEGSEAFQYKKQNDVAKRNELMNIDWGSETLLGDIVDIVGGLLGGILGSLLGSQELVGLKLDEKNTPSIGADDGSIIWGKEAEYTSFSVLEREYKDLKYTSDANYIIFRDIDLLQGDYSNGKDDGWTPIHFSGKLEGRLNMQAGDSPTITNIHVEQTGKLDLETTSGIGFFGTISNKLDENTLGSAGTAVVKNIHLEQVSVNNESTEVDANVDSLIEGVLGLLGGLVGGLLEGLGALLPIIGDLKLSDVIRDLLTLKQKSPDLFATGSFAGRIVGDVHVENCVVEQASVASARGISGGFVGFTEGVEQYEGLSGLLGTVVKVLSTLLNIVPGVGLGDLITILLQNDVPLGNLIPTGYHNPVITGCSVTLANGTIGKIGEDYNGGFVGIQTGTKISDCSVSGLTSVRAKNGAGGFAGLERDAIIKGLLNDAGIILYEIDAKSRQENCSVTDRNLAIEANEFYAGGFNGAMANSISANCTVTGLQSVKAKKYAGGFAGRATIGFGTTLGGEDEKKPTLVDSVSKLLEKVLASGSEAEKNQLLTLAGVLPSKIYGCTVEGNGLVVESTDAYAGGMIGQGDGVKIIPVEPDAENTAADGEANAGGAAGFGGKVIGLHKVSAGKYAGGVAGSVVTADAIGVLNNTLGVGQFIPFELSQVSVEGTEGTVAATEKYAAGACGLMLGGTADTVTVTGVQSIEAGNYTGGFAGRTGASSLASAGGLDILGLVKLNNVLSMADGIQVTIKNSEITGVDSGLTVLSDGTAALTDGEDFTAGGFIGESVASVVETSHVRNVKSVTAKHSDTKGSYAGGFVGRSHTGGLAGLAQEDEDGKLKLPGILEVDSLLNLVPYLLPKYTDTTVTFVLNEGGPQVEGQLAGGYAGAMQSGKVDNSTSAEAYAVYGLEQVKGESHAGGFAGKVDAGATASSDGLNLLGGILNLDIGQLLNVLQVYIPIIQSAGVKSAKTGFTVEATDTDSYAGGYLGYGGGVQIKDSNVTSLKHTKVTPPGDSLESANGESYFGKDSQYAVKGGKYAGGYAGCVDIDSAAAVGGGLKLLENIQLTNLLEALDVVASTIENSDVTGCVGGYSVLADGSDDNNNNLGKAGGFIGEMSGTIIKNSDANLFAYVIGREAAGGYAGIMEPGNVAAVLEDASILDGLLNVTDSLANLVQSFIPIIEDSETTSVPCGGAVRADGLTDTQCVRGLAGGYVGYNHGGRILGNAAEGGKECAAVRIRSVYGGEFAGGFTGLMETADLAGTGNLKLLFGLLETSNVLSLLGAVYPTETNTAVYGPLRKVDMDTWNMWAEAVGSNGVYGDKFPNTTVSTEEELKELIKQYAYGYNVKAGRTSVGTQDMEAGAAGGYVGRMKAGVVTNAHAWDAKSVIAYTSAGGFAGEMKTGGVAEVGKVSLIGLDITGSISAVQTFVPVIRNSDITGFQSGMTVKATGIPVKDSTFKIEKVGYAGGYVGHMLGGQIWGNWSEVSTFSATEAVPDPNNKRCFVANLRKVEGTKAVGGFAGQIDPASAAALDTASSGGLLGGLLQNLIKTPGDLLSLLNTTISTVRGADVSAWDDWGIVINGAYTNGSNNTAYAKAAGGFAGEINGAVIGEKDNSDNGVHVTNIRSVTGGEYAGGFFGLADVSAVLQVSEGNTSILAALLTLGGTSVLDAFRTYVYASDVSGVTEAGLEVQARDSKKTEYVNDPVYSGSAGGFGGALLNGSVKDSKVTKLRKVNGMNYTGGFIGHLGKSGTVDLDNLGALGDLLSAGAGVLDIFGSHVDRCRVSGVTEGFTVHSDNTIDKKDKSEIAGGFTGYADLGRLSQNEVTGLKQVTSGQIAGGFAGKTTFAYLADIKLNSELVKGLVKAVNQILKALQLDNLQKGDVIKIDLGIIKVDALYDGELVSLNLLGLDIKVGLAKDKSLATIYIGDSKIEINCSEGGTIDEESLKNEINISLIKANRTKIDSCTVTGVDIGYDVYGGGAGNRGNGTGEYGIAGGFVGWNNEGLLENNNMYFADVVRGAKDLTGPFTGKSSLKSNWEFNDVAGIEGNENYYRIYRDGDIAYEQLLGKSGNELQNNYGTLDQWKNVYTIRHMRENRVVKFTDLKDAVMSSSEADTKRPVEVYQEDGAMAVLMNNVSTEPTEPGGGPALPDIQDPCKDLIELRLEKVWKGDKPEDRPKEVVFHITRSYEVNGETITDDNFNKDVILTAKDAITEDVWEKILSGPEYTAYHVGEDGEHYYYTYHISETVLDGYTTKITYPEGDEYHYSITVTNKKNWFDHVLPETGGMGVTWIYAVGILLLAFYGIMEYRKRRCQDAELL